MSDHIPALLSQVLTLMAPAAGLSYLDATFGCGGHARALLEAQPSCRVVALDCDPMVQPYVEGLRGYFGARFQFYDLNFASLDQVAESGFAGVLFDLGVSSFQLDKAERGFSFRMEGPTDMRMDPRLGSPASDFLERASEEAIVVAVRDYGEEQQWRRVVRALMAARGTGCLRTTSDLAVTIAKAVGTQRTARRRRIHPATRTFQGLRMAVNGELAALERALPCAFDRLAPDGVLVVISFHSLEDRYVKRYFKRLAGLAEHAGDGRPQQERSQMAELLTRRPVRPDAFEVARNPRSRSAKLRAVRKLKQSELV